MRFMISLLLGFILILGTACVPEKSTQDDLEIKQQAEAIYKQLRSADKYQAASLYHDLGEFHAAQCVENSESEHYKLNHSATCDEMVRVLLMNAYFGE